MRLFSKILIILTIAAIGLFFVYNNGYFNQNYSENTTISEKSQPETGSRADFRDDFFQEEDAIVKKQIKVDLNQQKLFLFENGQIKKEYPISSGKLETPTPRGSFRVIYKAPMIYSKITDCWLSFWVGFKGNYGFHETPICKGKREGEDKIGTPDSAGCIRLKLGDAEEFYNWAEIETIIEIY